MRKIFSARYCGALTLTAVATWAATHTTAQLDPQTRQFSSIRFDMMRKAKDLPVHNIKDAF